MLDINLCVFLLYIMEKKCELFIGRGEDVLHVRRDVVSNKSVFQLVICRCIMYFGVAGMAQ